MNYARAKDERSMKEYFSKIKNTFFRGNKVLKTIPTEAV